MSKLIDELYKNVQEENMMNLQPHNPYLDTANEEDFQFKGWERIYDETFLSYYKLLSQRVERLRGLDKESFDYQTYTDMCLVMIRALLIESDRLRENYTLQNFLAKHSRSDLVTTVNAFIDQSVNKMVTVREALKIAVDKYIAHNDTMVFTDDDGEKQLHTEIWFKRGLFMKDLRREDYPFTIEKITDFIKGIVEQVELPEDITENTIAYGK